MKIILSIIICSALYGNCKAPFTLEESFSSWSECMYKGYTDSMLVMDTMGAEYINTNKIYVKFYCKEIPPNEEEKI